MGKKKILVCFGDGLEICSAFVDYAKKINDDGLEIQIFDKIVEMDVQPHNVLNILDYMWKEKIDENEYYFLTNIKDFYTLVYRVFHNTFKEFIFWSDKDESYDIELFPIYDFILKKEVMPEENLYKKVYVNNLEVSFDISFLNENKASAQIAFDKIDNQENSKKQILYRFQGQCYLLEASFGEAYYVNLDDEKVDDITKYVDIITPFELNTDTIEQTESMLDLVAKDYETCLRRQEVVHKVLSSLRSDVLASNKVEQKYYIALLLVMGAGYGVYANILINSLILQIYHESQYYKNILSICCETKELTAGNKYFVFAQSKYIELFDRNENATKLLEMEIELFNQISLEFKNEVKNEIIKIDDKEIDYETIVVMTGQFLGYSHPNSNYAIELCKYLKNNLNKEVWLFNTCEYLSQISRVPFFDVTAGNILEEYSASTKIKLEEMIIPFYQLITPMPSYPGIAGILEFLREKKPALIINIFDLSVVAEVCNMQTKTVSIFKDKTNLSVAIGEYIVVGKQLDSKVKDIYKKDNRSLIEISNESTEDESFDLEFLKNTVMKFANK